MTSNAAAAGDHQKHDDPMKQSILIIEHKIRNLEKRKLKLVGYLQLQRDGVQLSEDQLLAASKFDEVTSTLDFARSLKKQLSSLFTSTKQKKPNPIECEKVPPKVDTKIKEVLMFQNILECLKDETVQKDFLTGSNGAIQMSIDELSKLSSFSKMVSPKRKVEEGKPLFEDQLKTVSKHYLKLIESKPNIVVGTTYANLKDYLLKIERSGYLDSVIKNSNNEVKTTSAINSVGTKIPQTAHQAKVSISDHKLDNIPISSTPSVDYTENKIKTIYFTNNNVGVKSVDQTQHNRNTTDSVFNTSFDFLQDSQLEEDHNKSNNISSIPTQTFSSSLYSNNGPSDEAILKILSTAPHNRTMEASPFKDTKLNHLENIVNVSNSSSWVGKPDINWQNRTQQVDNNILPRENWSMSQMIGNGSNDDWLIKNNWVQMAEMDTHPTPQIQPSQKSSSSNYGLVTNGYTDNLNALLQKSVVFNKQDSYPVTTNSNNSSFYHNNLNYQQSPEHNMGHYNNSKMNYDRSHANDFNKRSVSSKPKMSYAGEGDSSRNYQQNNAYSYNNRSYKNHSQFQNNDYSRISRQT